MIDFLDTLRSFTSLSLTIKLALHLASCSILKPPLLNLMISLRIFSTITLKISCFLSFPSHLMIFMKILKTYLICLILILNFTFLKDASFQIYLMFVNDCLITDDSFTTNLSIKHETPPITPSDLVKITARTPQSLHSLTQSMLATYESHTSHSMKESTKDHNFKTLSAMFSFRSYHYKIIGLMTYSLPREMNFPHDETFSKKIHLDSDVSLSSSEKTHPNLTLNDEKNFKFSKSGFQKFDGWIRTLTLIV